MLDREINRLVYSEVFHRPGGMSVSIDISDRIMVQQLSWAKNAIPKYEGFLAQYGDPSG